MYITAAVSVAIEEETLSTPSTVCTGVNATVSSGSSKVGVSYYLRDDANDAIVDGPVVGTGSGLSFNSGFINAPTTFNLYAKTLGKGLSFDGSDDRVNGTSSTRGISQSISVAVWVKQSAIGTNQFIAHKYGANGFLLIINVNGKAQMDGRDGVGAYKSSGPSVTSVNDNEWHYVVGTINTATGLWTIYVDGVLESFANNGVGGSLGNADDLILVIMPLILTVL